MSLTLVPILVTASFSTFRLSDHLQDDLRKASSKAAILTCEQVASIRTIASLRRENGIYDEFSQILDVAVNKALVSTLKSAAVDPLLSPD